MRGTIRWWAVLAGGLVVALGLTWGIWTKLIEDPAARTYRIGLEDNPPSQAVKPNGEFSGYAVETVAEAARRRGIRLKWEYRTDGPDHALRSQAVDLWPIMTVTKDRQRYFHFSDSYEISEYLFLVRADSPLRQASDLNHSLVSHKSGAIYRSILRQRYPEATLVEEKTHRDALQALCSGQTQAALVELRAVLAASLLNPPPCPGLRAIPGEGLQFPVALASTFAAAVAADALRAEIDHMAADGTLSKIMSRTEHIPGGDLYFISQLKASRIRARQYQVGTGVFGLLFVIAIMFAARYRRARNQLFATERELRDRERELRLVADSLNEMVMACDMRQRLIYANPAVTRLTGYTLKELEDAGPLCWVHVGDRARMAAHWNRLFQGENFSEEEYRLIAKDGDEKWISASWGPLRDENGAQVGGGSERDITSQKRMEETLGQAQREREILTEQLQQSQKLEGIGRLAGGVAHDFNNLLTVINGYCGLMLDDKRLSSRTRDQVEQVKLAGERAANLTHQLLAFSRKQIVTPEVLDLNAIVSNSESLLRRLVGEDIEFVTLPAARLGMVCADSGQIGQVLFNLAVNARDAMPKGGKLIVETADVELGGNHAATPGEARPGPYVMLAVSDTGCGMDEQTRGMIFEPFFTTKPTGKGTGLGLAMVYGIVKQSGGSIRVFSEVGKGTTFRIYLPRTDGVARPEAPPRPAHAAPQGTETILVVEDQEEVRRFACEVLRGAGYRVIEAPGGPQALREAERFPEAIHLLLTDVVMPGMSGPDTAERLKSIRPGIEVVYVSGYTDNAVAHSGVLDPGVAYLAKPFSPEALIAKVREVLSAGASG
jgi:PAS domain S-box-containing protein